MKRYGMPYKGSKNSIAKYIVNALPPAENFYDIFCGGGAVLEAAIESKKYKNYYANDFNPLVLKGLEKAFNGEFKDERRWISKKEFQELKASDPYVAFCYSFGGSLDQYSYGTYIEPYKKALYYARVFNDFNLFKEFNIEIKDVSSQAIARSKKQIKDKYIDWWCNKNNIVRKNFKEQLAEMIKEDEETKENQRQYLLTALRGAKLTQAEVNRILGTQMAGHYFGRSEFCFPSKEVYAKMQEFMPLLTKRYEEIKKDKDKSPIFLQFQGLERFDGYEKCEEIARLDRLKAMELKRKVNIFYSNLDYREVKIKPNSIIYCDPPYAGTEGYSQNGKEIKFDYGAFYDWCKAQSEPCFISEYTMTDKDFVKIREIKKRVTISSYKNDPMYKNECLFMYKPQVEIFDDPTEEDVLPIFRGWRG